MYPQNNQSQASNTRLAPRSYDLVTLKNGSEVKGNIVERNSEFISIATSAGNVLTFSSSDVESVSQVSNLSPQVVNTKKETLFLKDGTIIKGQIIKTDDEVVQIRTVGGSIFTFEKSEVEKINFQTTPEENQKEFFYQGRNISLFSLEERIDIYNMVERKLWLTIVLGALLPAGGYYYLWSAGSPYFNFIGDTLWQDITISASSLSVSAFLTYLNLDTYLGFGFYQSNPGLVTAITLTFTAIFLVIKGLEYWRTIDRTLSFNKNLREVILPDQEVSVRFNLMPEFFWRNDEVVINYSPLKVYF